jgi:hypothetical protein
MDNSTIGVLIGYEEIAGDVFEVREARAPLRVGDGEHVHKRNACICYETHIIAICPLLTPAQAADARARAVNVIRRRLGVGGTIDSSGRRD